MDLQSTWPEKNNKLLGDLLHGVPPSVRYHLMPLKSGLKMDKLLF